MIETQISLYYPSILAGAFTLPCFAYILGLYAPLRMEHAFGKRFSRLAIAGTIMLLVIVAFGYVNFSARIGRGSRSHDHVNDSHHYPFRDPPLLNN